MDDIYVESETALDRVRQLNDALRQDLAGGTIVISRCIAAMPADVQADIFAGVRTFDEFSAHNDPYGEHDFGSFLFGNERIFWKIDLYEEPEVKRIDGQPAVTRVLTIMLAEEW